MTTCSRTSAGAPSRRTWARWRASPAGWTPFRSTGCPLHEQVDHGIVAANIRGRVFELEETRTWERSPHMYGEILASSLADAGHLHLRARRRARPPRAVEAAPGAAADSGRPRQHQGPAGDLRQGRHRHLARRQDVHRRRPAARVLRRRRPAPAGRPRRRVRRGGADRRRLRRLPRDRPSSPGQGHVPARRARSSSRSCASKRASRCRWIACWPSRCARFAATQEEFRAIAGRLDSGDPMEAWRKTRLQHPAPGRADRDRARTGRRAPHVPRAQSGRRSPGRRRHRGRRHAGVLPLVVCQHVDARARSRPGPSRAMYYLTDVDPSWPERAQARAPARLQRADAVDHLDARGVSRALPPLSAPAQRRFEGPPLDAVRAGVVRRRAGRTTASR